VDYVLMGAGIPREIPAILDGLADGEDVSMSVHVEGASDGEYRIALQPRRLLRDAPERLQRPRFFPIVASNLLASMMVRKASGRVDGLIVEGPSAGGHNAPPRGGLVLDGDGQPVYGPRDEVALERVAELGVPFYLAGGYGAPEKLRDAVASGAAGVQVGTAFAFCVESGFMRVLKEGALAKAAREVSRVITDVLASPTGFPFKVLSLEGTLSEVREYLARPRVCNLGFLQALYRKADGAVGYRCPAEPEASWIAKGGEPEQTKGRKCLCNALIANLGLGLEQPNGYRERALVTVGAAFERVRALIRGDGEPYSAKDVIEFILGDREPLPQF
jgi:nitronate monooxygenase